MDGITFDDFRSSVVTAVDDMLEESSLQPCLFYVDENDEKHMHLFDTKSFDDEVALKALIENLIPFILESSQARKYALVRIIEACEPYWEVDDETDLDAALDEEHDHVPAICLDITDPNSTTSYLYRMRPVEDEEAVVVDPPIEVDTYIDDWYKNLRKVVIAQVARYN